MLNGTIFFHFDRILAIKTSKDLNNLAFITFIVYLLLYFHSEYLTPNFVHMCDLRRRLEVDPLGSFAAAAEVWAVAAAKVCLIWSFGRGFSIHYFTHVCVYFICKEFPLVYTVFVLNNQPYFRPFSAKMKGKEVRLASSAFMYVCHNAIKEHLYWRIIWYMQRNKREKYFTKTW